MYSWLDFTKLAEADVSGDAHKVLGQALKGFFQNGGGYCYLVSTTGSSCMML